MRKIIFILLGTCLCLDVQSVHAAIHISEVYPAPESGKYEWVEITNTSPEAVSVKGYVLRDKALHALVLPHIILEKDQFVIATSSGVLNNSGDTVELVLNGTILESLTYPSGVSVNQSYNLCGDEWIITDLISPGFDSDSCLEEVPSATVAPTVAEVTPTRSPTLKATPTVATIKPTVYSQSAVLGSSQKAIQSFTQKHMPLLPTIAPTEAKALQTLRVQKPAEKEAPRSNNQEIYVVLGVILLLLATLAAISIYLLLKKHQESTYNEINDT